MSAKKDGMANIGGFLGLRDPQLAERLRTNLVLTEGFPTYGGLAGRDLAALAIGFYEALDEAYLCYRIRTAEYMAERLRGLGIPLMEPPGGHAIYLDVKALLPHLSPADFPGQSLACALYLHGCIRSVEVGSVMFGSMGENGKDNSPPNELVRLAFPRRVYPESLRLHRRGARLDQGRHRPLARHGNRLPTTLFAPFYLSFQIEPRLSRDGLRPRNVATNGIWVPKKGRITILTRGG